MHIQAISSVSPLQFQGNSHKTKKQNIENSYPQQTAPVSKRTADALRKAFMAGMMAASVAGGMTSCAEADADAAAAAVAWVYNIGHDCNHKNDTTVIHDTITKRDTIIQTVIEPVTVKEYPFHLADSLIAQGLNIGAELDGPAPGNPNIDVAFIASKAHNNYDNKFYETHLDSAETNKNQLSLVTKVLDLYDSRNPKTSWIKTNVVDVPGKGIKLTRFVSDSTEKPEEYEWNYAGYEIRSNGARSNKPGINTIYDNHNNMIWKGEYEKGQQAGTFMYGTFLYDEEGNPYTDAEGNPQKAHYNFDNAKMWSERAKWVPAE